MIIIKKNTFPQYPGVAHGEPGDIVRWEARSKNTMALVRINDGKTVMLESRNQRIKKFEWPKIGVVVQNKSKGYILELEEKNETT